MATIPEIPKELEKRIWEVIGPEDEPIEDIARRYRSRHPGERKEEPSMPGTRKGKGASGEAEPFKNVIPSDAPSKCARSLEVWITDWRDFHTRMDQTKHHLAVLCRGITDLVVFHCTCWDENAWQREYDEYFKDIENQLLQSRIDAGGPTSGLTIALKIYGKRHPKPVVLIDGTVRRLKLKDAAIPAASPMEEISEKIQALREEVGAYRGAHPEDGRSEMDIAYAIGKGEEYQELLKQLDEEMARENRISQKR